MARQFHPTREAATLYLIDCGFTLSPAGRWFRLNRFATVRETKRGFVIDLKTIG